MLCNDEFSSADVTNIWRLKAQNVKISNTYKQEKRGWYGNYEILSKYNNEIIKKRIMFRSINKNISAKRYHERYHEQFQL